MLTSAHMVKKDLLEAIVSLSIEPVADAVHDQLLALVEGHGVALPNLELDSLLREQLGKSLAEAYCLGLRDGKSTLIELLDRSA